MPTSSPRRYRWNSSSNTCSPRRSRPSSSSLSSTERSRRAGASMKALSQRISKRAVVRCARRCMRWANRGSSRSPEIEARSCGGSTSTKPKSSTTCVQRWTTRSAGSSPATLPTYAGNGRLAEIYRRVIEELYLFRLQGLYAGGAMTSSAEHARILKAIKAGDADGTGTGYAQLHRGRANPHARDSDGSPGDGSGRDVVSKRGKVSGAESLHPLLDIITIMRHGTMLGTQPWHWCISTALTGPLPRVECRLTSSTQTRNTTFRAN